MCDCLFYYLKFVIYEKNNFILLYLHTAAMVSKNFNTIELNCFGQFWWESSLNFEWTLERERYWRYLLRVKSKRVCWEFCNFGNKYLVESLKRTSWEFEENMLKVWLYFESFMSNCWEYASYGCDKWINGIL